VASTSDRDLEALGLTEGQRRSHIVAVDAASDYRRAPIDQQVEAEAGLPLLTGALHEHIAPPRITPPPHHPPLTPCAPTPPSTARASLRAPIRHGHRPRLIGGCTDECELCALRKQWLASPKRSRTHVEAVLVNEVVLDERVRGPNASVEQQILPRRVLELGEP